MSFAFTSPQMRDGTKTVTRRSGWLFLTPGTLLRAVVRNRGLKLGETMEHLGVIRVLDVRRESLSRLLDEPAYGLAECQREGFPDVGAERFVDMFIASHRGTNRSSDITRIEFEHLPLA